MVLPEVSTIHEDSSNLECYSNSEAEEPSVAGNNDFGNSKKESNSDTVGNESGEKRYTTCEDALMKRMRMQQEQSEWMYVKQFMEMEKLTLPAEIRAMPSQLRVYMRHDYPPSAAELKRPARVQKPLEANNKTAYIEGYGDYNIWYGKGTSYTPDGRKERIPATGHCHPFLDSGYTQADLNGESKLTPLCIYFAKGICALGANCKYHHRVPTLYENENLPLTQDVFGREKFAAHKDDMSGVGSFNSPSLTLFVGDYNRADDLRGLEHQLLSKFCIYGAIKEVKVIPNRNFSFVTFCYRCAAEFALVAMNGWKLTESDKTEILTVRWATAREAAKPTPKKQR